MKKKTIINGLLAVVLFAGLAIAIMSYLDFAAKREIYVRPADYVVPEHQREYEKKVGPALTPPPADLTFLRSLEPAEFTDKKIRFEFSANASKELASSDQVGYTVEKLDLDKLDTTAAYVRPLALGIAGPFVPEKGAVIPVSSGSGMQLPITYYGMNGELLPKEELDKIKDIRPEDWVNTNNLDLRIDYEVKNLGKPRQVGSALYDSAKLARLGTGYTSSNFYVSHDLRMYLPSKLCWVVDIAHGPCDYIDIPLEKGQEAIFADAAFRLITDPFMAYSNSSSEGESMVEYDFSDSYQKNQKVAIAISPKCMNRLFTVQFLDKYRKPIGYDRGVCYNSHIDLVGNYDKEEGKYLRIYHYAGIKRFVLDIGKLPGTPEVNGNVDNLMNVKIPYVYAENVDRVEDVIHGATQMDVSSNAGYSTKLPQGQYYDITPLELLQEIQKVSSPGSKISVELEQGKVIVGEPVKTPFMRKVKEWLDKIF